MNMDDIDFEDPTAEADPGDSRPQDSIDVYDKVSSPTVDDSFLQENNLGLGVYTDREYWQQVESYKRGLYADAAFTRLIRERAIQETKHQLALEGWPDLETPDTRTNGDSELSASKMMEIVQTHEQSGTDPEAILEDLQAARGRDLRGWSELSEEEREEKDRRKFLEERGEEIWESLSPQERSQAVRKFAGVGEDWRPPFWRFLEMRHEASRSREGRLIDNVFARVEEIKQEVTEAAGKSGLLGGEK